MQVIHFPEPNTWDKILSRPVIDFTEMERRVAPIIADVRSRGDLALKEYTTRYDAVIIDEFLIPEAQIVAAERQVPTTLKNAIRVAYNNIDRFHRTQLLDADPIETMLGVKCWRKSVPIERVGLYIPGGTAPLFSSLLMLAIPARIAGCKQVIICTPPSKDGSVNPVILYAAQLTGVHKVFRIGGAQAVAALAYGTETVPRVDKILGPGNQYVTVAKQLVSKEGIAIDMPAGPSEVAIFADESANPAFVAADLLSQAEHGIDSQVLLVTTHEPLIPQILDAVKAQTAKLPRAEIINKVIQSSKALLVKDAKVAMEVLNRYAPEHLILATNDPMKLVSMVTNAGSVFLGHYTPESAGDYASGTNHTLPTNGFARAWSGVSVDSFLKKITFQYITPEGLRQLGPTVEQMAAAEQLEAHKNAVSIRLQ